jgi:acyl-CoA synthetase (NDP forming)
MYKNNANLNLKLTINQMLISNVHLGHTKKFLNVGIKPYLLGSRNNIYILNISKTAFQLLECVGVKFAVQKYAGTKAELNKVSPTLKYPVVLKVEGPLHKSDVGGVILNISDDKALNHSFDKLMQIEGAKSVLIQPMIKGMELFIGAKKESNYPHIILCGLGGIFVEVLKDISASMIPITEHDALKMIRGLKAYPVLKGVRGQKGINIKKYAEIIIKISELLCMAPEISELDLNPLLAFEKEIIAVDVRILIEK